MHKPNSVYYFGLHLYEIRIHQEWSIEWFCLLKCFDQGEGDCSAGGTLGRDDILDKKINFQNLYILILIMLIWVIMKWNVKKIGCYLVSVLNERLSKFFNLHCFQSDESVKFLWIQNKKNHYIWNLNLCNYKIQKIEVCFWYMVQNTSGSQLFGLYLNYHEG